MNEMTLEVHARETRGKNSNRRLRTQGLVPAVVYGGGRDPVAIQVSERKVQELMRSAAGENTVFLLELAGTGKSRHTMIRDLQIDSVTHEMIHIDFQRVLLDQEVRVAVPIELHGTPEGVKNEGGMLDFVTREVEITCLPTKIPVHFDLDVAALHVGQHLEARELEMPEGVRLLEEPERVIVSVSQGKLAVAEVEEEGEELLEAATEEPELIGKTQDEE